MNLPGKLRASVGALLTMGLVASVAAVECYDESKIKQDLEKKGFTVRESVKVEKMELYAYASDQDKRWMLFARPQQGMVEGAPPGEEMFCPLDAGDGGVEGMKQSRYYKKYFQAEAPGTSGASAP